MKQSTEAALIGISIIIVFVAILVATLVLIITYIEPAFGTEEPHFYTLTPSTNLTEANQLQSVLNEVHYANNYDKGYFDCSDMSIYTNMYLKDRGYNSTTLINYNQTHMWVAVREPDGWLFVETTNEPERKLGVVVWHGSTPIDQYFTGMMVDDPLGYLTYKNDAVGNSYSLDDLVST